MKIRNPKSERNSNAEKENQKQAEWFVLDLVIWI
jgi:hypothetical protein